MPGLYHGTLYFQTDLRREYERWTVATDETTPTTFYADVRGFFLFLPSAREREREAEK